MIQSINKTFSSLALAVVMFSGTVQASIVEFNTSHGSFKVNLHDKTTPLTVANFLQYITSERYNNTIIHRSETNFVVQGGGFAFNDALPLKGIETFTSVKNEPVYSNVRGTIAMAKQANNPNSATSQWFVSLNDNSANLDVQNSGFTVFGEVIEDGMEVFDAIASLPRCNQTPTESGFKIDNVPVNNNEATSCETPGADNFVTIYNVTVLNDDDNTDNTLNSVKNTLINKSPEPEKESDSSGGNMFWLLLLTPLALFQLKRKK
ncbi:peptidylprolyl isomerase [Thalassotalea piscium]|uniref:Peptidyl-prolyl cis-trans isomerase n=1 Tax=Thalassotalea piscium TaxID=1230533 RepID=A0A7X0TTK6_9GAMM|nr:peptidylprolyl isomerase [Thalassotalea piscium]MBB6543346.1 cyclophilin family peptidyl-prolyl cis-trans isomerase [Thalassotalea piscium]